MTYKQDKIKHRVSTRMCNRALGRLLISYHNTTERNITKVEYIRKFCLCYIPKIDQCIILNIQFLY